MTADRTRIVNRFGQSVCGLRADELRMSSSGDADNINSLLHNPQIKNQEKIDLKINFIRRLLRPFVI